MPMHRRSIKPTPLAVFSALCDAHAHLYAVGEYDLHEQKPRRANGGAPVSNSMSSNSRIANARCC